MNRAIPRSSRVLEMDHSADANAAKRRRAWRATLRATPAWLASVDVSDPSDVELDAIWEAGGRVAEGRPFAAAHLLAAYRAGVAAGRDERGAT